MGILMAMVLLGAGCSRAPSENSQFPPNGEGLFLSGIRPPAGDTTRLLRNAHYLKVMGRAELAIRELEAAYQQDPGNIKVLNALALACDETGDFNRAQKLYQEALSLDVSNQALNNNLCFSYYLAGQLDKAEACFRQALDRNPQNIMARNNLGLLLCRRGRTEEARRLWQDAEGQVAAQKKMQQVMVALGTGETSHYAQLPQSAPVAAAPLPRTSTPAPGVAPAMTPAKVALPSPPAPQPQVPAAPPAQVREPVKVAANPSPAAVSPDRKPPTLVAAAVPAPPPQKPVSAVQTQKQQTSPQPAAKSAPAVTQSKQAPQVLAAAAPTKAQSPPAPPKQTADKEKKPAPAATPPPTTRPEKIKLGAAQSPTASALEKLTPSGIEVSNATGALNLARETRARLKEQGFTVVAINNNHGRGADDTVIYYRPEAEKVARALNTKFFSKSRLELGEKFAKNADIKVVLGQDFVTPVTQADKSVLTAPKIAAGPGPSQEKPAPEAVAAAPAPVLAQVQKTAPAPAPALPKAAPAQVASLEAQPKSFLTAAELENAGIEIRNGSGAHNLAHKARSMLAGEGFNVTLIGNHIDFGTDKTIIYYRPGAEKIARNLKAKFFSNSPMEQSAKLHDDVAVKVLLGKDLLQRTEVMAKLDN
jgi:Tfp pilus assembly protein PilF